MLSADSNMITVVCVLQYELFSPQGLQKGWNTWGYAVVGEVINNSGVMWPNTDFYLSDTTAILQRYFFKLIYVNKLALFPDMRIKLLTFVPSQLPCSNIPSV